MLLRPPPLVVDAVDGSLIYRTPGFVNGEGGFFELALNPDTRSIFHRTFVGVDAVSDSCRRLHAVRASRRFLRYGGSRGARADGKLGRSHPRLELQVQGGHPT